jgi:hypothetical protein
VFDERTAGGDEANHKARAALALWAGGASRQDAIYAMPRRSFGGPGDADIEGAWRAIMSDRSDPYSPPTFPVLCGADLNLSNLCQAMASSGPDAGAMTYVTMLVFDEHVDLLVAHSCDPGYDCMPVLVLQCGRQELEDVVNYDRDSAFLDQDDIPVDWMPVIQPWPTIEWKRASTTRSQCCRLQLPPGRRGDYMG